MKSSQSRNKCILKYIFSNKYILGVKGKEVSRPLPCLNLMVYELTQIKQKIFDNYIATTGGTIRHNTNA